MKKKILYALISASLTASLAACGGGDGKASNAGGATVAAAPPAGPPSVAAQNVAPVAHAGAEQTLTRGATAYLDSSRSKDENGDKLSYNWTLTKKPLNSTATLSDPSAKGPGFVLDQLGDYEATLVVSDGKLSSAPATVKMKAVEAVAVNYKDILFSANPNTAESPLWGRVQCWGENYWMKNLKAPIMGNDGAGNSEVKYEVQNSGDRKAYYFSVRGTDIDTAGSGNKRCQQIFIQPSQALPLDEPFWYGIDVAASDMGTSADEQLIWQWHINKNDANGQAIQLSPYLAAYLGGKNRMTIQIRYNRNDILHQSTLTKLDVYTTNEWTPDVFHRFVVKAFNSRKNNDDSTVQIWLDGKMIVDYKGKFGFKYDTEPSDAVVQGFYHWTNGNIWDATVPKRNQWIRGSVLVREKEASYTPQSVGSLLDDKTIWK